MGQIVNLTDHERKVVLLFAESDMSVTKTAQRLFFHRNSVYYQLEQIHKRHGLNPYCFYDLCKLVDCAKAENRAALGQELLDGR